ncbi:MAG: prolyl oligopeptidase family serine peptidase [bacterium]|nr:prolyl oligopeptidase family serine peptidase [bacterium]
MEKNQFILEMNPYRKIYGDLRIPENPSRQPLIVFCHGFKGFKDWGGWHYALDRFCMADNFVISVNFSHNGTGADLMNFTELDMFAENTIGKEIEDLKFLLGEIENNPIFSSNKWEPRIGIIGHSRGGGTVILASSGDDRINAVVTWAGMASWDRYLEQKESWKKAGYIEFENARTKQMMRMNYSFIEDIENNLANRDIQAAERKLNIPHLIIHGDGDEAVPLSSAELLFSSSNKERTQFEIIRGGSHTFGTAHPFNGTTPYFDEVINKTISWFGSNLK